MGSPTDFENLLSFVQQNRIRPYIGRLYPAKDLLQALVDIWRGQQIGKSVLDFAAA